MLPVMIIIMAMIVPFTAYQTGCITHVVKRAKSCASKVSTLK